MPSSAVLALLPGNLQSYLHDDGMLGRGANGTLQQGEDRRRSGSNGSNKVVQSDQGECLLRLSVMYSQRLQIKVNVLLNIRKGVNQKSLEQAGMASSMHELQLPWRARRGCVYMLCI